MGSGFSTLDPGHVYEKYPQLIANACYENLFKFYENNGTPQPCLADSYEFSEDGLTLTVTLKDHFCRCCIQHQPYQELKGKPVLYL